MEYKRRHKMESYHKIFIVMFLITMISIVMIVCVGLNVSLKHESEKKLKMAQMGYEQKMDNGNKIWVKVK